VKRRIGFLLSFALLFLAAHRLPAPISELPEATPTATPSPPAVTPTPTPSPIAIQGSPEATVREYFDQINQRNAQLAYQFFSEKLKSRMSFEQYRKIFAATVNVRLLNVQRLSATDLRSSILVEFEEIDSSSARARWTGPMDLVRENAGWRINSMQGVKKQNR
jgi:hypothetical protein